MNKSQLISTISEATGISSAKAEKVVTTAIDSIVNTLAEGGSVSIVGFGSFGVKARSARKVRNPRTGQEIMVAATTVPYFKVGKNLKETVDSDLES